MWKTRKTSLFCHSKQRQSGTSFVWNPRWRDRKIPKLKTSQISLLSLAISLWKLHTPSSPSSGVQLSCHMQTTWLAHQRRWPTETKQTSWKKHTHGVYIPRGALPGLEEVLSLKQSGRLAAAAITMAASQSLKYSGPFQWKNPDGIQLYYQGPLLSLWICSNNVNTMAVLALSSGLGMDDVHATLIANPTSTITSQKCLSTVQVQQKNVFFGTDDDPTSAGAVTSSATFDTFLTVCYEHKVRCWIHFCWNARQNVDCQVYVEHLVDPTHLPLHWSMSYSYRIDL